MSWSNSAALRRTVVAALLAATPAFAQQDDSLLGPRLSCREALSGETRRNIAGGQDADVREFPFIVQLRVGRGLCGGSLIAPGFVLTAAHCVMPQPSSAECVAVGPGRCALTPPERIAVIRPTLSGQAAGAERGVTHVFAHPGFHYGYFGATSEALNGDIAILRLDAEYDVSSAELVTIADPSIDASFAAGGECARVAGWGLTDVLDSELRAITRGRRTSRLQSLNLELAPRRRCQERYPGQITDTMLCAGDGVEGYNTCKGDSGGPLVVDLGVPVQVGVVSWAYGCAQAEHYTVFTRVGAGWVRDWIDEIMHVE